jgi:PAS domain S-box-containing protein
MNIRCTNDKPWNTFVNTLYGKSLFNNHSPSFEGTNMTDFQDFMGNQVVQDEVDTLKQVSQAVLTYFLSESDTGIFNRKITFIKKYAPLNLYIGGTLYTEDLKKSIQERVMEFMAEMRFGKEGYIFINKTDGTPLIKDGQIIENPVNLWNLTDPDGVKVIQEEYRASRIPGGDYIFYKWRKLHSEKIAPKVSYVIGDEEFDWMIGNGIYLDELYQEIAAKQQEAYFDMVKDILVIVMIFILVALTAYVSINLYVRKGNKQLNYFIDYFHKAGIQGKPINKDKIIYTELVGMADAVNYMVVKLGENRKTLNQERLLLRYIIDAIPDAITYKQMDGTYLGCNKAFENLMGLSRNSVEGKKPKDIFPEATARKLETSESLLSEHQPVARQSEWIHNRKGASTLLDIVKTYYYDNKGNRLGIISVARNITDQEQMNRQLRKAIERSKESDQMKHAFLANISHEIRTPLNSIIGFTSLLSEKQEDGKDITQYLNHINRASGKLVRIVDNILYVSMIESGELIVNTENTEVSPIIERVCENALNNYPHTPDNVYITKSVAPEAETFQTDSQWLEIVLDIIVDNAVKYTPAGEIKVDVKLVSGRVIFAISDKGIGIEEEYRDKVFESFYQAPNTFNKKYQGTGCGLFIARHVTQKLGGEIWYDQNQTKGLTFYVTLPFLTADDRQLPQKEDLPTRFDDQTILVAEDEISNSELLKNVFTRRGARVLVTKDGYSTVEMVRNNPDIDIVLMDYQMPDKDGATACNEIKKIRNIPVIIITAYAYSENIMDIIASTADDFLFKPLDLRLLFEKIRKALFKNTRI